MIWFLPAITPDTNFWFDSIRFLRHVLIGFYVTIVIRNKLDFKKILLLFVQRFVKNWNFFWDFWHK